MLHHLVVHHAARRRLRALALLLLTSACTPRVVRPARPVLPVADAPADLRAAYPIDARPAQDRRPGSFHIPMLPLPQLSHGELQLRPGTLDLVDRTVRVALASVPRRPDAAPLTVEVWVLRHAARRDRSDAAWVSTATGGAAGTVGQLLYPEYYEAEAHLRLRYRRGDEVIAVRDVRAAAVRARTVARTWGFWWLYRRNIHAELTADSLREVHQRLAAELVRVTEQILDGRPLSAGEPPVQSAQHALRPRWRIADSLAGAQTQSPLLAAKYDRRAFSVLSAHDILAGRVIGRIGAPMDNIGYDIGLSDRAQLLLQVSALGLDNAATVGVRGRVSSGATTRAALELRVGTDAALALRPAALRLTRLRSDAALVVSTRPRETTWFLRAGPRVVVPFAPSSAAPRWGAHVAPGAEVQLSPTTAAALQLVLITGVGDELGLLAAGAPIALIPQLTVGFR